MLSKINIKSEFFKSVLLLSSGTVLAQLVSLIAIPIVSRYYGPEENAYLGLFLRISTLVATIATARLEFALPMQKNKDYAFGIYQFSFYVSILVALLCILSVFLYQLFTFQSIEDFLFMISIPVGIALISFYNLGNNWALRNENYRMISFASLKLSLSANILKIGIGILNSHYLTLIGATLISYFFASSGFIKNFISENRVKILNYKSKRTKVLIQQNKDFYTYNLFHVLIDLSRDMLIASMIWLHYSKIDFGSFEFAFRMLKLPVLFLGTALSQVFFRKANELIADKKLLMNMSLKMLIVSFSLGLLPFSLMYFYGKEIFSFFFGNNWENAGEISQLLCFWLFVSFIFTPISYIPIILKKQKAYFWINLFAFLVLLVFCYLAYNFKFTFQDFVLTLSLYHVFLLFGLILWFLVQINRGINDTY